MSSWRFGGPPTDNQSAGQLLTSKQSKSLDLPALSELVSIQQTLLPPDLANAFDIPVASIPFSAQINFQDSALATQGTQTGTPKPASHPAVGTGHPSVLPFAGDSPPVDSWMRAPPVTPHFFPGNGFGSGFLPGGNNQPCQPGPVATPGVSVPFPLGPMAPPMAPGRQPSFPPVMLFPPMGPETQTQNRAMEEDMVNPLAGFSPSAPPSQWQGLTGVGALQEHQHPSQHQTPDGKPQRRTRVFWTSELKKRFEEAVRELGIEHATPKLILRLMNVEGLTRENVASHLQKYRAKQKRSDDLLKAKKPGYSPQGSGHMSEGGRSGHEDSVEDGEVDVEVSGAVATEGTPQRSDCSSPLHGRKDSSCA